MVTFGTSFEKILGLRGLFGKLGIEFERNYRGRVQMVNIGLRFKGNVMERGRSCHYGRKFDRARYLTVSLLTLTLITCSAATSTLCLLCRRCNHSTFRSASVHQATHNFLQFRPLEAHFNCGH